MNKVILTGRLTKDVETRTTGSGVTCAQFTIAVQRRFKDANGSYQSDFINCVAWRQTGEFISKYFNKGSKISIVGCLQSRSYEDKNGNKVFVTEVIVEEAEFVESKSSNTTQNNQSKPVEKVAPPFEDDPLAGMPFEI